MRIIEEINFRFLPILISNMHHPPHTEAYPLGSPAHSSIRMIATWQGICSFSPNVLPLLNFSPHS